MDPAECVQAGRARVVGTADVIFDRLRNICGQTGGCMCVVFLLLDLHVITRV